MLLVEDPSIVLDQVDNGGSFGGIFVSSGVILALFAVFLSWLFDLHCSVQFLLRGQMMYRCGGGLDQEGRE